MGVEASKFQSLNYSGIAHITNPRAEQTTFAFGTQGGFTHHGGFIANFQLMINTVNQRLDGILACERVVLSYAGILFGMNFSLSEKIALRPTFGGGWLNSESEVYYANGVRTKLPPLHTSAAMAECALRYYLTPKFAVEAKTGVLIGTFKQKELPADLSLISDKHLNPLCLLKNSFSLILKIN